MRRKSTRASVKASPEKAKEEKTSKKPRRHSKRHKPTSSESESEDEVSLSSNENVSMQTEKELWTVTQTEQSNNDIGKIKICLARPNPVTPERNERVSKRLRNKSQVLSEDSPSEDKPTTRRSRRSRGGSSPLKKEETPQQDIEQFDDKKGKGKSKGKHKSKIVEQTEQVDEQTEMQSEISENVQVTAQSPQNVDNSDADIVDRDLNQFEDDNSINKSVEEQSLDNQDTNDNIVDASSNDISNNNVANDIQLPPVDVQICIDNENASSGSMDASCNITMETIETSFKLDDADISMKEVTHFEINDSKVEEGDVKEETKQTDFKTESHSAIKEEICELKAEFQAKVKPETLVTKGETKPEPEISSETLPSQVETKVEDGTLQSEQKIKEEIALKAEQDAFKDELTKIQCTDDIVKLQIEEKCKTEVTLAVDEPKIQPKEAPIEAKTEAVEAIPIVESKTPHDNETAEMEDEPVVPTPQSVTHLPEKQVAGLQPEVKEQEIPPQPEAVIAPESPKSEKEIIAEPEKERTPEPENETVSTQIKETISKPEHEFVSTPDSETVFEPEKEKSSASPIHKVSPEPENNKEEKSVKGNEDPESKNLMDEQMDTSTSETPERTQTKSESSSSSSEDEDERKHEEPEVKEKSRRNKLHQTEEQPEEASSVSKAKTPQPEEENTAEVMPKRARNQKPWGESTSNLMEHLVITSSKLLEMYPTLSLMDENLVKLSSGVPRERERGRERQQEIEKHIERRVSIDEKLERKYEKEDSTTSTPTTNTDNSNSIALNRKISIVEDEASSLRPPPSPAKHDKSSVLYITNLVRPFTVKQLRGLLERTGKIVEGGFWTDKIKSKCYVQYETEEEAEATRNALHSVQWPIGNGKKLIIDFSTIEELENCKNPPVVIPVMPVLPDVEKENQEQPKKILHKDTIGKDDVVAETREWPESNNEVRVRSRPSFSPDVKRRHSQSKKSRSPSPEMKKKKREEPVHQRAMDDLFRKTEATPSIYWQPLSPEEIALKQQQRLERLETHKRKMESQHQVRPRRNIDRPRGGGPYRRRY